MKGSIAAATRSVPWARSSFDRALAVAALGAAASFALPPTPAAAEVAQKRGVRVKVTGRIAPKVLPRKGTAPVSITIGGRIGSTLPGGPPQLRTLTVAINRHGRLQRRGLPRCRVGRIDPSTSREALAACGRSLVGKGSFAANVKLPEQSPFPSKGRVLAFNGVLRGRPAILAHIYGTRPAPTSYVLPFVIRSGRGAYGTVLQASFPRITGDWGFVTGIAITLRRNFTYRGKQRSFLAAACPAPRGFPGVSFPLVRTGFAFEGGIRLASVLTRSCRVR